MRKAYQSDLSDEEWSFLEPQLPVPNATGRPRTHSTREVLNAVFYIVRGGCAWRLLPHDFPPWKTVSTTTPASGAWMEPGRGCTLSPAQARADPPQEKRAAQRGHSGQPVGQDHRGRRRTQGVRREQEGQRPEATPAGGHGGL